LAFSFKRVINCLNSNMFASEAVSVFIITCPSGTHTDKANVIPGRDVQALTLPAGC